MNTSPLGYSLKVLGSVYDREADVSLASPKGGIQEGPQAVGTEASGSGHCRLNLKYRVPSSAGQDSPILRLLIAEFEHDLDLASVKTLTSGAYLLSAGGPYSDSTVHLELAIWS
jgi:hypothetical protein